LISACSEEAATQAFQVEDDFNGLTFGSQMPSQNGFGIQREATNNVCYFIKKQRWSQAEPA
jgi:hypothetical protein